MISSERILGALVLAARSLSSCRNHCPFCLDHSCPHAAEDSSCHCRASMGIWQDGTLLQGTHLNVRLERNAQPHQVLCQPDQISPGKESKYLWVIFCFCLLWSILRNLLRRTPATTERGFQVLAPKKPPSKAPLAYERSECFSCSWGNWAFVFVGCLHWRTARCWMGTAPVWGVSTCVSVGVNVREYVWVCMYVIYACVLVCKGYVHICMWMCVSFYMCEECEWFSPFLML